MNCQIFVRIKFRLKCQKFLLNKMSGSFGASSPPTTETNGKNSSDTSVGNGIHLCPFQLMPPINEYTYSILKRICRKILKDILAEEEIGLSEGKLMPQGVTNKSDSAGPKCRNDEKNSSIKVKTYPKYHHRPSSSSVRFVTKHHKATQTVTETTSANENNRIDLKTCSPIKTRSANLKNYTTGFPIIQDLRQKVRNGQGLKYQIYNKILPQKASSSSITRDKLKSLDLFHLKRASPGNVK